LGIFLVVALAIAGTAFRIVTRALPVADAANRFVSALYVGTQDATAKGCPGIDAKELDLQRQSLLDRGWRGKKMLNVFNKSGSGSAAIGSAGGELRGLTGDRRVRMVLKRKPVWCVEELILGPDARP
jgi:hypothetical protein